MTINNNTLPLLASYTPGQIEFIKFLQSNRGALTVYDICTVSQGLGDAAVQERVCGCARVDRGYEDSSCGSRQLLHS